LVCSYTRIEGFRPKERLGRSCLDQLSDALIPADLLIESTWADRACYALLVTPHGNASGQKREGVMEGRQAKLVSMGLLRKCSLDVGEKWWVRGEVEGHSGR
jgi:hypothetical protein